MTRGLSQGIKHFETRERVDCAAKIELQMHVGIILYLLPVAEQKRTVTKALKDYKMVNGGQRFPAAELVCTVARI